MTHLRVLRDERLRELVVTEGVQLQQLAVHADDLRHHAGVEVGPGVGVEHHELTELRLRHCVRRSLLDGWLFQDSGTHA